MTLIRYTSLGIFAHLSPFPDDGAELGAFLAVTKSLLVSGKLAWSKSTEIPPMQVEVKITRKDVLRLNRAMAPRYAGTWILLGIMLVGAYGFFAYLVQPTQLRDILIVLIVPPLAVFPLVWLFLHGAILLHGALLNERAGLGWHRYTIEDDGLREVSNVNETLTKWKGFQRVILLEKDIVIQQNAALAHDLPLHCFDSREDFEAFYAAVKKRMEASQ